MKLLIQQKKRSAVSPVIATLLLIAIAVAAAIIVYAFVTGLIGGLSSSAGSNLVTVTANLAVPSGSGSGLLVISIQNSANNPVTGIQVLYTSFQDSAAGAAPATCMGQTPGLLNCAGAGVTTACGSTNSVNVAPFSSVPFCNAAGAKLATGNPLQVGGQTGATEGVLALGGGNLQTGTSYSMTVTVDFANGNTHSQAVSVTAQI